MTTLNEAVHWSAELGGGVRIALLQAGHFRSDAGSLLGVVPRLLWGKLVEDEMDADHRLLQALNCLLVETPEGRALVETGIGDRIDEKNRRVGIVVSEEDLAVAIGKKGQNARLTSRLIGWKLDIIKLQTVATTLEEKKGMAASGLTKIPGIDEATAQRLVVAGFASVELFDGVESGDLVGVGFTPEEAGDILQKVAAFTGAAK